MADRTTLKSYFQTGDKPTQTEFATLIDSLATAEESTAAQAAADAAQATADDASARGYKAMVKATYNGTTWTINKQYNVASVASGATVTNGKEITVTFTNAMPDAHYVVSAVMNLNGGDALTRNVTIRNQATGSIGIVVTNLNNASAIYVVVFDA